MSFEKFPSAMLRPWQWPNWEDVDYIIAGTLEFTGQPITLPESLFQTKPGRVLFKIGERSGGGRLDGLV